MPRRHPQLYERQRTNRSRNRGKGGKGPYIHTLRESTYGTARRHDAAFDDEATAAFLLGTWISSPSSNVREARYIEEDELLEVIFLDGSAYQYFGVHHGLAMAYCAAPSKGGYIWDYMIRQGVSYVKVA